MTVRRLAALVVAIVLVAGGFVIRNARGDDTPDDQSGTTTAGDPTGDGRDVVCIPELRFVCDAVSAADPSRTVTVQSAGTTFAAFVTARADDDLPLWITVDPYPGMVAAQRTADGTAALAITDTPLASTPLSVAVLDQARLDVLVAACGDQDLWACLGEHAGRPWTDLGGETSWGTVRPSVGDVGRSPSALVSFAAAASGYFGTTSFSRATWEADTGFLSWLRPLARTVSVADLSGGTPLATMATRASAVNVAATTDAEVTGLGASATRFAVDHPSTAMSLDAVLAAPESAGTDADLVAAAAAALGAAGWGDPTPGHGPSPSTTLALLALWEATT